MAHPFITELAQRLGKSEEEVLRFLETLWQLVPPSPETQPYFFRYLDERFGRIEDRYEFLHRELERQIGGLRREMEQQIGGLRKEMEQQIGGLRKEMEQGFAQAAERDEALRREFQQQVDGLRQEFQQQIDGLRREMQQGFAQAAERDEALRREFQQQGDGLRQEFQQQIDGLRREMQQQVDGLRREMQQGFAQAAERDEALRREIARLERWLFTLWVPVLGALVGVLGLLLQVLLRLS